MKAHTPQDADLFRRRSSIGGGYRTSMGSSIPRFQSRIAQARASTAQPSYDFLTGGESTSRPRSRDAFRQSNRVSSGEFNRERSVTAIETEHLEKSRREIEELKAEVKALRYTIDNRKQEEEVNKLRHESELRDARRKAEEDFKRKQAAESEKNKAVRQYESLLKETTEIRDAASNQKAALDRRVRDVEESKHILEEELEDIKNDREENVRGVERKAAELELRNETLQRAIESLQQDSERKEALHQDAQQRLAEKDSAYGALEAEVLRLKAQTGDAETLGVIKRELSEQVSHIRTLEATNREQAAELKHFRRLHKSIEVVEEEKRTLQQKVDSIEGLENEIGEARIQRQRLEDERLAWTAYLQSQAGPEGHIEFDSPEALARALVEERLHAATLVERIGALEAEAVDRDGLLQGAEGEKKRLQEQVDKLKSTGPANGGVNESKARLRLERQRALAVKEVEYLRAQLKTFDTEDITFQPENVDQAKLNRIQELEDIVDKYRQEVQTLQSELFSIEAPPPALEVGMKRPREEADPAEECGRLGQLSRKTRKLQDELNTSQTSKKVLQKELSVAQERLTAATEHSKTRILSLRSNPTSDLEAIKQSTLDQLRRENADILKHLSAIASTDPVNIPTVPLSALSACQREIASAQEALTSERKRNDRLKKVWLAKSQEFRELIVSLLGWDVVFMPNGKMRVTSWFYPSKGDEKNSIVFDGERGTMKVSGGTESAFAKKIRGQIKFWVEGRGSIPCFLAALTLEFWEEAKGDGTLRVEG